MSTAAATRRIPTRFAGLYFVEWFVLANVLIAQVWIYRYGVDLGGFRAVVNTARLFGFDLLLQFAAGLGLRSLWALIRKDRFFLRKIRSTSWIVLSVRMLLTGILSVHGYGYLKLMVPILNPVRYDEQLWAIDRALFLGWSPNVLFLELFSNEMFIKFVDFSYAWAFFATLLISTTLFLTIRNERIRIAFATGNAVLWLVGAYLYVLVPALGPVYSFPEVWADTTHLLGRSQYIQLELLTNYQRVLAIRQGHLDPGISMIYGVAAFPSMHVAFQLYFALWIGLLDSRAGILCRLGVGVIFIGSIITGWHYLIDGIAGVAIALPCYFVTKRVFHLDRWDRMRKRVAARTKPRLTTINPD